jgi:ribosome-associated toxin RatA of RatAB toxin-antitoxin module
VPGVAVPRQRNEAARRRFGDRFRAVHEIPTPTVEIRRSALIGHSAASTFDLIEAAEHYPEFLPWCASAIILARDDSVVAARLAVDYRGLRFDLTTRNPKRRPHWLAVRLEEGPFRRFEGEWRLVELGPDACKIEFALRYEFDSALVGKLADRVFGRIADTMLDAFATRADDVLGRPTEGQNPSTDAEPENPS